MKLQGRVTSVVVIGVGIVLGYQVLSVFWMNCCRITGIKDMTRVMFLHNRIRDHTPGFKYLLGKSKRMEPDTLLRSLPIMYDVRGTETFVKAGVNNQRVNSDMLMRNLKHFMDQVERRNMTLLTANSGLAASALKADLVAEDGQFSRERYINREQNFSKEYHARESYHGQFLSIDDDMLSYSATFERRDTTFIRVLVILPGHRSSVAHFRCVLRRSRSDRGQLVHGHFQRIPYNDLGLHWYGCGFVHCPVPPNSYPEFISVLTARMSSPLNVLPVNYPGPPYNRLTRCYPAVHGNFTDVSTLVTALETSRYFGTDKFIFYNYSIPEDVNKVLLHYEREGIVEMRNWKLPFPPDQIHYWGQMASIHDCVFSQLGVAKYVLLADIDEVVVPKSETTVYALADKLLSMPTLKPSKSYGALMFQNAFFFLNGHDTRSEFHSKYDALKYRMGVFLHTNRSSVNPPFYRSKLLVIPESVDLLQTHAAETLQPGWLTLVVEPKDGLMHHYRKDYDPQAIGPYTEDTSLLQYSSSIIPRVKDRLHFFKTLLNIGKSV